MADSKKPTPSRGRQDRQRERREAELAKRSVRATAGGGLVEVRADGHGVVRHLTIAPEAFDGRDPELLADLILSAIAEAQRRADDLDPDLST